jgi:hypothetical protein
VLLASGPVATRVSVEARAPVDVLVAPPAREPVRAVARVEADAIDARTAVGARVRVALVDDELAVGA